jgi:hypothetical protein
MPLSICIAPTFLTVLQYRFDNYAEVFRFSTLDNGADGPLASRAANRFSRIEAARMEGVRVPK